jgi:tellurite resistance protein TehA-like permease
MLDQLITYIVWWYKTVYQVLFVAWTDRITTRRDSDS